MEEYDAVLVASGAHRGVRLPMEGSELDGVLLNTEFLRRASLGEETSPLTAREPPEGWELMKFMWPAWKPGTR